MGARWILLLAGTALLPAVFAQSSKIAPGDWPNYTRDLAGTKYSPLDQISPTNVTKLLPAWTFSVKAEAPPAQPGAIPAATPLGTSAATPIVVNGVMYLPAGKRVKAKVISTVDYGVFVRIREGVEASLRALASASGSLSELVGGLNRQVCANSQAGRFQERGNPVGVDDRIIHHLAGRHVPRPAHDQRHAQPAFIDKSLPGSIRVVIGDFRMRPFRHVQSAVIRCENDDGPVGQFEGFQFGQQAPHRVIQRLNHARIDRFEGPRIGFNPALLRRIGKGRSRLVSMNLSAAAVRSYSPLPPSVAEGVVSALPGW